MPWRAVNCCILGDTEAMHAAGLHFVLGCSRAAGQFFRSCIVIFLLIHCSVFPLPRDVASDVRSDSHVIERGSHALNSAEADYRMP